MYKLFLIFLMVFSIAQANGLTEAQVSEMLILAEQGDIDAQFYLGEMYYFGYGVEEDDVEAMRWYSQAADQGDEEAQLYLDWMYEHGYGVKEDLNETMNSNWYELAAVQERCPCRPPYYYGRYDSIRKRRLNCQRINWSLYEDGTTWDPFEYIRPAPRKRKIVPGRVGPINRIPLGESKSIRKVIEIIQRPLKVLGKQKNIRRGQCLYPVN